MIPHLAIYIKLCKSLELSTINFVNHKAINKNDHTFQQSLIGHAPDMKAFQWSITVISNCGWVGERTRRSGGKQPGGATYDQLDGVAGSPLESFLNSLVSKKVSAQQIADEITRLLSPFPSSCQTPVGHFCSPAKGQTWKRANLQTWSGNLCYGERILTFESHTWGWLGAT